MPILLAGTVWLAIVLLLLARVLRQFRSYAEASCGEAALPAPVPTVAVIVPARDEAANIGSVLASLSAQTYPHERCSILVIDDGSRDQTQSLARCAAERDRRIQVQAAGRLPAGWLGKPRACWMGALRAGDADWLCFIDADVQAAPALLTSAVGLSERRGLDMLSLHPFQKLGSFWEQLIIPAGLLIVACAKDRRALSDPTSTEAEANGQFILIRRTAYMALGGHSAVRGVVCEDRALARRAKAAGLRVSILSADHLAAARMYRDLGSLWEGFSKNAIEIMGDAPRTLFTTAASVVIAWALPLLPGLLCWIALNHPDPKILLGAGLATVGSAVMLAVVVGTMRRFRCPVLLALLFPVATALAAAVAWRSVRLRQAGWVTWKRRQYRLEQGPPSGMP